MLKSESWRRNCVRYDKISVMVEIDILVSVPYVGNFWFLAIFSDLGRDRLFSAIERKALERRMVNSFNRVIQNQPV